MKILVSGGTGSFGQAFVKRYHKDHEITVFSRDEDKQHQMRLKYPDVTYQIGDVRDRDRVFEVVQGFDCIFHAAALKQVPSSEFFPMEAVKTNIIGTNNVLDAARGAKVICLSTDKAVYPINAMGTSKAMMEKLAIAKGGIVTRYGNVMKSRGSIIPIWEEAARNNEPLGVTNPDMTRFLLSLDDSIDLVMYAMEHGKPGEIFVKKAPACTMIDLAHAISPNTRLIGLRHGEKMHESLISMEEMYRAEDEGDYYRIVPDVRGMNYDDYFFEGNPIKEVRAYSSDTTTRLDVEQIKELLETV
jgi:UDP-N-acetylglucosamine 4,6-dehydratase